MCKIDKIFVKQKEKDKFSQLMQLLPDTAKELHYDCHSSNCYIEKVVIEMKSDQEIVYVDGTFHPKHGYWMQTISKIYGRGGDSTEVYYGQKHQGCGRQDNTFYVFTNVYCRDCFLINNPKIEILDILQAYPIKK